MVNPLNSDICSLHNFSLTSSIAQQDKKIFDLVFGKIFPSISLIVAASFIGYAYVASAPIALAGAITAIFMSLFSILHAKTSERLLNNNLSMPKIEEFDFNFDNLAITNSVARRDDEPIGMRNYLENNCWANCIIQIFYSTPALFSKIKETENFSRIFQLYENYDKDKSKKICSLANLVRQNLGFEFGTQEDVAECIDTVLNCSEELVQEYFQTVADNQPTMKNETMIRLEISDSFEQSFNNFFHDQTDQNQLIQRKFATDPEFFLVQLKRFRQDENYQSHKICSRVDVPSRIRLNPEHLSSGSSLKYKCTGFVYHTGNSPNAGHYVSFVKRGNSWWMCDDDYVQPVAREDVKKYRRLSYIFSYSKVD